MKKISTLAPLTLLAIPLIAMQFTTEVNWQLTDFVVAGVLLLVITAVLQMIYAKIKSKDQRVTYYIIALIVFLLIWAELGVGIFGTPFAGN